LGVVEFVESHIHVNELPSYKLIVYDHSFIKCVVERIINEHVIMNL
jgi:hypothetical protein